jgi:hypothetical protein
LAKKLRLEVTALENFQAEHPALEIERIAGAITLADHRC